MIPAATLDLVRSAALAAAPRCGDVRVVCVDGPAGSGKSTMADAVGGTLDGAPVVHLDDLYEGWHQPLGAPLAARLHAWLLDPWRVGLPGRHLRFDWLADRYVEWVEVPPAPVVILEGCGSASAQVRPWASLVVWVQAPRELRLERGLARDVVALERRWRDWMASEAAHYAADGTRAAADVVIDGTTGSVTHG